MPTLFASKIGFPELSADGSVKVLPLLNAAEESMELLRHLGTAYAPARNDILGNVKILRKFYESDPEARETFQAIVEMEMKNESSDHHISHMLSLLWLKRGLAFISLFLHSITEEHKEGNSCDSLQASCMIAYEASLKPYHGWISSTLFSVISRCLPYKSTFLGILAGDETDTELVIAGMTEYVSTLQANVQALHTLLEDNHLNFPDVV